MMTTPVPTSNNHGKKWTPKEDECITAAPEFPNNHFAQILWRSEEAVKCRRAVLAARLHKSSGQSIEQCAEKLHADVERTTMVVKNEGKGVTMKEAKNTKIKPFKPTTFSARPTATNNNPDAITQAPQRIYTGPTPPSSSILTICDHIKRSGGDIDGIWAQDTLVPTLVQFHSGFQSYALFISKGKQQAASSSKAIIRFKDEPFSAIMPRTVSTCINHPSSTQLDAPSNQPSDTLGCSSTPGDTGSASCDQILA